MKQGAKSILAVNIGCDLNTVSAIKFKLFQKPDKAIVLNYPSSNAFREQGTNIVDLVFTAQQTYTFDPNLDLYLDTLITMSDSTIQPDTEIVTIRMLPTLFTKGEL